MSTEPAELEPGASFTDEELEKIEAWAQTPGVELAALPVAFRAAVEHRRDELNDADDGAPPIVAGSAEDTGPNVRRLTATELIAVVNADAGVYPDAHHVNVPAALEELRARAATDTVDGALEAGQPWSEADLNEAAAFVANLEEKAEASDEGNILTRFAEDRRRANELIERHGAPAALKAARRTLDTYRRRRHRLGGREPARPQAGRMAALELILGEAEDTLVTVALELGVDLGDVSDLA